MSERIRNRLQDQIDAEMKFQHDAEIEKPLLDRISTLTAKVQQLEEENRRLTNVVEAVRELFNDGSIKLNDATHHLYDKLNGTAIP